MGRNTIVVPLARHPARRASLMLVKLDRPFVRFRSFPGAERSQVSAMPGFRVFLAGVKPILSGFHLSNHSAPRSFDTPLSKLTV
jgi:hypothetical protein